MSMKSSHIIAVLNICKRGDTVFLRKLLASNCNFNEVKDHKSRNALHYCTEIDNGLSEQARPGGRFTCARLLLESNFRLQNQPDCDGFLPFHHAVIHGNIPLVKLLIARGDDVNCLVTPRNSSEEGDDVNDKEKTSMTVSGRSSFHLAVIYANYEMLDFLLSDGFDDDEGIHHAFALSVNIQDAQSATALHYAVQLPEGIAASMIKCIMEKSCMEINCVDAHGRTPLIWAATIGAALSTGILLELGANPRHVEESGLTALHCAASRSHTSTVQVIIHHLAKVGMQPDDRSAVLNACDADNCTPLFYSTTMGHVGVTAKLLAAGADATTVDSRGRGLFHCVSRAINSGNVENVIKLLLCHGADPKKANFVGDTPLHEACAIGNKECVAHLLQIDAVIQKCGINAKNSSNQTPLLIATLTALNSNDRAHLSIAAVDICRKLIEAGAYIEAEDDGESSPLSVVKTCLKMTPNYRPALELKQIFDIDHSARRDSVPMTESLSGKSSYSRGISISPNRISQIRSFADHQIQEAVDMVAAIEQEENIVAATGSLSHVISSSEALLSAHSKYEDTPRESSSPRTRSVTTSSEIPTAVLSQVTSDKVPGNLLASLSISTPKQIQGETETRRSLTSSLKKQPRRPLLREVSSSTTEESSKHASSAGTSRTLSTACLEAAPLSIPNSRSVKGRVPTVCSKRTEIACTNSKRPVEVRRLVETYRKAETPTSVMRSPLHHNGEAPPIISYATQKIECEVDRIAQSTPPSATSNGRSVPLRAQHFPVWTQTSFDCDKGTSADSRRSRNLNPERINESCKPRRRPNSCDYLQIEKSDHRNDSRAVHHSWAMSSHKVPPPTITPYLTPVTRWPRAMASMLLMGEVSPLYCARTLNAASSKSKTVRSSKRREQRPKPRVYPIRSKSALEARVKLSQVEKDFACLASQVLEHYENLLTQRQKLAKTQVAANLQHAAERN